jgi:tetratricopeptide (TPR) repeat protein
MVMPIPVDAQLKPIVDSVPVATSVAASEKYNASAGYIVDLKVTEFDKYYRSQTIEVKELKLGGTPAEFEDQDAGKKDAKDGEIVHSVPSDQFLREGLLAFRDARYGKCVSKMEVLLTHNPDDINALFYTAVSYVKLEMYSKAIPLLDKIIADPNNVFDEEAEWYKALALEGNGDTAAAQELFKKISTNGGFYSKQAASRLK